MSSLVAGSAGKINTDPPPCPGAPGWLWIPRCLDENDQRLRSAFVPVSFPGKPPPNIRTQPCNNQSNIFIDILRTNF